MMAAERSRGGGGRRNASDATTTSSGSEVSSPEVSTPPQQPLPSGLSALIQAATSQLGHLAEAASILQQSEGSTFQSLPSAVLRSSSNSTHNNFPERLMGLCCDPVNLNIITFLPDGKFFALRHSAFEETILQQQAVFGGLSSCSEFLSLAEQWGFSTFKSSATSGGITILRHPKFVAGDYEQCRTMIRYGETPEAARVHALPERARSIVTSAPSVETTTTRSVPAPTPPKRRLSPRRESSSSATAASKPRVEVETASRAEPQSRASPILQDKRMAIDEDSVRSVAKSIAADKLSIQGGREASSSSQQSSSQQPQAPATEEGLVETAVTSATQEIVSEAIESLLRDEGHSKETFMKHEKELSRSSIPGVVPVCKQLFSSTYKDALSIISGAQTPSADRQGGGVDEKHPSSAVTRKVTSDEQQEQKPCDERMDNEDDETKVLQEASSATNSATAVAARPLGA